MRVLALGGHTLYPTGWMNKKPGGNGLEVGSSVLFVQPSNGSSISSINDNNSNNYYHNMSDWKKAQGPTARQQRLQQRHDSVPAHLARLGQGYPFGEETLADSGGGR